METQGKPCRQFSRAWQNPKGESQCKGSISGVSGRDPKGPVKSSPLVFSQRKVLEANPWLVFPSAGFKYLLLVERPSPCSEIVVSPVSPFYVFPFPLLFDKYLIDIIFPLTSIDKFSSLLLFSLNTYSILRGISVFIFFPATILFSIRNNKSCFQNLWNTIFIADYLLDALMWE